MGAKEKTKQHFEDTAADYNNSHNGNLFALLPEGRYELFGIDFSENMIEEARKKCGDKAVFAVADAEELPFDDNAFDIIVCNASFHHYIHPDTVVSEMHRVLKTGEHSILHIAEKQV